jgi:hypothetical protein
MKLGCKATMLKQKCSRRSGNDNYRHNQKKHVRVALMWRWFWSLFIGRVSFIMGLFHVVRQSITVVPKPPEAFEGGSAKEEAWRLD